MEADRGKATRINGAEIVPASLDVEEIFVVAVEVAHRYFDRCVATTVEYELRVGTEEPRCVDA
jgi:hypothetical protein